ncbi:hypothetical protein [Polyangium aurulentum]|uniref:hypothetical protein n=1 Tax=Polyangium aurulentum TaxID=2567896 RepID=UPI0010AE38A2|nr:hypothetical protein [Polyangium aurulentum]UQA54644.1 hypothetical protein E8A73_025050 [Polyangium aurulentum]
MRFHRFMQRLGLVACASFSFVGLSLAAGALLGACGAEDTTSSKRVALTTRIVADDGVEAPFTNAFGWSIQLDRASISIGPLYYFDGAPIFSSRLSPRAPRRDALAGFFGIGVAFAHPGHYQPGNAMGQVLAPFSVDLAKGPADLPPGDGVAGVYRSGRFSFGDPAALDGFVVVVEGRATKDAMTRVFRAEAGVDDVLDAYGEPKLDGCVFDGEPDVQEDGTVTVHVKPSVWLDQVEFDAVPESVGEDPAPLPADGTAFRAFTRGLEKGSAVVFTYSAQETM